MKKTITIPEDLYDITIDQYRKVQAIPEGDELRQVVETISILCHVTTDEVMGMEKKDIDHIGGVIGGIIDKYDDHYPLERVIELDTRYGFHPNLSRITLAEFADIETLCKDSFDKHLPQVMGILYRPIVEEHGEFYRIADYDGEDRSEFFREMKMAHALGAAAFFFAYREGISRRFGQLFQGGEGSKLSEKYGWFATFVHLAGEDITKLPQVERTHLETALAWLAYEQDRALLEKQKLNL